MTIRDWSKTASSNQTGAPGIDWSEGTMLPPTINDSARAMMADVAKWRDDFQGSLTTGGSVNAYTLTTNAVYTSLTDGIMLKVRVNITNTAAATLNIDSLGAKALRKPGASADVALVAGDLVAGTDYLITYGTAFNSAAGGWLVMGPSTLDGSILAALSVGTAAIAASAVTNAKLATMATVTVKANVTGGAAVPTDVVIANLLDTVGSTRGTLLYRGASAYQALVPSTAGFVLRDGGSGADPAWVGGMTLLASGTASSVATLDLTLTSGYRAYKLIAHEFAPATNGSDLYVRFSQNNGVSYVAAGYAFSVLYNNSANAIGNWASSSTTAAAFLCLSIPRNTSSDGNSVEFTIFPGSASIIPKLSWVGNYISTTPNSLHVTGSGDSGSSVGLATNIRFLASAGNITTLRYSLYGLS